MPNLAPILSGLLLGACSVVGVRDGTEEPRYQVIGTVGSAEIRTYGPRIAAETTVPGDEIGARGTGFRRLAGYIFGANTTKAAIAMTAPVAQSSEQIAMTAPVAQEIAPDRAPAAGTTGAWIIRFTMPAKYTRDALPTPDDPAVHLVAVPSQTMAVLRFTGTTAPEAVVRRQAELAQTLRGSRWRTTGPALAWFYDPPWTIPFLRRNEVAVPVEPAS